jgi:hypothetical protein
VLFFLFVSLNDASVRAIAMLSSNNRIGASKQHLRRRALSRSTVDAVVTEKWLLCCACIDIQMNDFPLTHKIDLRAQSRRARQ